MIFKEIESRLNLTNEELCYKNGLHGDLEIKASFIIKDLSSRSAAVGQIRKNCGFLPLTLPFFKLFF
jgi:hypothetical protein